MKLSGCSVADDFTRALGDTNEGRLKAALDFRASGNSNASCPAATGFAPGAQLKAGQQTLSVTDGQMYKSPVRENRILRRSLGRDLDARRSAPAGRSSSNATS